MIAAYLSKFQKWCAACGELCRNHKPGNLLWNQTKRPEQEGGLHLKDRRNHGVSCMLYCTCLKIVANFILKYWIFVCFIEEKTCPIWSQLLEYLKTLFNHQLNKNITVHTSWGRFWSFWVHNLLVLSWFTLRFWIWINSLPNVLLPCIFTSYELHLFLLKYLCDEAFLLWMYDCESEGTLKESRNYAVWVQFRDDNAGVHRSNFWIRHPALMWRILFLCKSTVDMCNAELQKLVELRFPSKLFVLLYQGVFGKKSGYWRAGDSLCFHWKHNQASEI